MPDDEQQKRKTRQQRIFSLVICFMAAWLGTVPYVSRLELQLVIALPGGLLLSGSLRRLLDGHRLLFVQDQFRRLLEHLLTRMTAGATLEKAFIDAPSSLVLLLGKKSALLSSLQHMEKQLSAHQPLNRLLTKLASCLPCHEAAIFLKILPALQKSGGNVSQYIRQQLRMVTEEITLHQEISAETTQRRTEALILALMPFGLTICLQKSSVLYAFGQDIPGIAVIGMISAYVLAILAAGLTLSALGRRSDPPRLSQCQVTAFHRCRFLFNFPGRLLGAIYQNLLPENYGIRLKQILYEFISPGDQDSLPFSQPYFEQKALFCLIGLGTGSALLLAFPGQIYWLLILPVLLSIFQDSQIFALVRKKQLQYRLDYPAFINLVTALLQAGLSLHTAMRVCLDSIQQNPADARKKQTLSVMQKDLAEISGQLQLGLPIGWIIEKIASACSVPEIQAALMYLVRYERMGGQEILDLMQMQSAACWSLYRQAMRKQVEQQSLRLLLPMMLDLISVILTAILPAWISLRSI
jgi:Flp pilus assembly protein TadB